MDDKTEQEQQKEFRGTILHIAENGKFAIEMKGASPLELFAVIGILFRKMSRDYEGEI